jgi:dTMP kinase
VGSAATSRDRPFLVALEGIDGAGKATQGALLRDHLAARGLSASVRSYPVYDSFFGATIRRMLDGEGGPSAAEVDPRSMALWYALDRQDDLRRSPLTGDVVVLNRFTLSNAVYQSARVEEAGVQPADEVCAWVMELENRRLGLPVPDLTVVLDVPPTLSYERAEARARVRDDRPDVYERAGGLLARARARYLRAAEELDGVVVVACGDEGGSRSVGDVHADVRARVEERRAEVGRVEPKFDSNIRSEVVPKR